MGEAPRFDAAIEGERVSPYRAVFDLIETESKGPAGISSLDAYEAYADHIGGFSDADQPDQYFSMAVTSGGYKRNPDLSIPEVIGRNAHYGDLVKQDFLAQRLEVPASGIVLPSELGKVKGWNESDYLLFWFHVISGAGEEAGRVEEEVRNQSVVELPGFSDHTLPHEVRWPDYTSLVDGYSGSLLEANNTLYNRTQRLGHVALILDPDRSLGARAERALADSLNTQSSVPSLEKARASTALREEVATLQALGATTVELV